MDGRQAPAGCLDNLQGLALREKRTYSRAVDPEFNGAKKPTCPVHPFAAHVELPEVHYPGRLPMED